jgi:hypothetical protein
MPPVKNTLATRIMLLNGLTHKAPVKDSTLAASAKFNNNTIFSLFWEEFL